VLANDEYYLIQALRLLSTIFSIVMDISLSKPMAIDSFLLFSNTIIKEFFLLFLLFCEGYCFVIATLCI
jgi:hypothetical protein